MGQTGIEHLRSAPREALPVRHRTGPLADAALARPSRRGAAPLQPRPENPILPETVTPPARARRPPPPLSRADLAAALQTTRTGSGVAATVGLLAWTAAWWAGGIASANPVVLAVAFLYAALVEHECSHGSLPGGRRLNAALGWLAGVVGLCPFASYRAGHRAHHRHLGDPRRDPTVSPQDHPPRRPWLDVLYRLRVVPALYWGGVWWPYVRYRPVWRDLVISACLLALAGPRLAAALLLGFVGGGVLYEHLFTMHQHIGLRAAVLLPRGHEAFSLRLPRGSRQLAASRSVPFRGSALLFHFNLHKEHHAAPGLPWYRLPALHAALRARRPDLYTWTREDLALLWARPGSARTRLTPHLGDA